jgi:hypothetical protein
MRERYGRTYNFGRRLTIRSRLGIKTESWEELLEPIAVDEFIALNEDSDERYPEPAQR